MELVGEHAGLLPALFRSGVAGRLLQGLRRDEGRQQVAPVGGEFVVQAPGAQQVHGALHPHHPVGSQRHPVDRDPCQVPVGQEHPPQRPAHLLDLLRPAAGFRFRDLHLGQHDVEDEVEQLVPVPHVRVQRGVSGLQLLREPPHAQGVESLGVEDAERRDDDPVLGQGHARRRLLRPAPRRHGNLLGHGPPFLASRHVLLIVWHERATVS